MQLEPPNNPAAAPAVRRERLVTGDGAGRRTRLTMVGLGLRPAVRSAARTSNLYDGLVPTMEKGDVLGHEFMGEVVEVGPAITNLEVGDIRAGDVVAVWGAGPVGQFAIASARMLGAERIIAIDRFPHRLKLAADKAGATDVLNSAEVDVQDALQEITAHSHGSRYANQVDHCEKVVLTTA